MSEAAVRNLSRNAALKSANESDAARLSRVDEIDGIRGWAALAVVVFHLWLETFGKIHTEFIQPHYWFFFDGPLAVYIFFILSGDALSTPFFSTRRKSVLDKMVMKRYFRLVAPIFVVTFVTVVTIWLGLTRNVAAASILHREDWLGRFVPSSFNAFDALMYPFLTVFGVGGNTKGFNAFLWTMPIELCGSIFVFLYLYVHEKLKYPKIVLAALILVSTISVNWYALFFIGVLLSYLRSSGALERIRNTLFARVLGPLTILSAYAIEYYMRSHMPISSASDAGDALRLFAQNNEKFIMAPLFVVGAYLSIDACAFFRNRLSKFLGTLSFPIYLAQMTVLCTLSSYLVTRFVAHLGNPAVCILIALVGVATTIFLGYLLSIAERHIMRGIDRFITNVIAN